MFYCIKRFFRKKYLYKYLRFNFISYVAFPGISDCQYYLSPFGLSEELLFKVPYDDKTCCIRLITKLKEIDFYIEDKNGRYVKYLKFDNNFNLIKSVIF